MRFARTALAAVITVVALLVASRLELSKDLTGLFPHTPEAEALARVTRAFGGGDVALVLVRGDDAAAVERAAEQAASELRTCGSVARVMSALPPAPPLEATEAWRFAGPVARERLAHAVTEEGMRERLRETRALLLAPGAAEASELLARDPLRLSMIPWQDRVEVAVGAGAVAGGAFVADEGRARLVVVEPVGHAFDAGAAARFTSEAEAALDRVRAREPGTRIELTGGHVIARQTEAMMRSDLERSGVVSLVLASVVFLVTFRRGRALVAILPPLAAGTVWTSAVAALLYPRLSAVATAFAAVVVGVGVDTGVHVYGRLLRRRAEGLSPRAAADAALRDAWRPTLSAALAAAGAFGCLALSDIEGMRQLGVLCAVGELLTAVAILVVVPEIGALLESGSPPSPARASWLVGIAATKPRALVVLAAVACALAGALVAGPPRIERAVATLDAGDLPALETYEAIHSVFGGTQGQIVVVSADDDPERARARADAVAEAAERLVAGGVITGYDALARLAPSPALQRERLAERDGLDLPSRAPVLARLLEEEGFSVEAFEPALASFERPSPNASDPLTAGRAELTLLERRHLAADEDGALAVTYVRMASSPGAEEIARTTLRAADPDAILTGLGDLERSLARTLRRDLPRVLAGALVVVIVLLGASLRRPSRVGLVVGALLVEVAIVLALSRPLGIGWHIYDALLLPVLLGITLDEIVFLLEAAERSGSMEEALAEQAPLGTTTALTTAAGFGALVVCRFDGLVDVGKVGALGSLAGLFVALVVVPAVYRLAPPRPQSAS